MNQLRLTRKVQKAAALRPSDLVEVQEANAGLGCWTVNIFDQDQSDVLIFVNDRTLYSFVLFGVRKEHYKNLGEIFLAGLRQLLTADGFDQRQLEHLLQGADKVAYSRTSSKQVIGNMNDLVWHYQFLISDGGGLSNADIGSIIHRINRMPQKNIDWLFSVDAVRNIAENA